MKTPYDKLAKIYAKYFGHMNMVKTINFFFFCRTRRPVILGLGIKHWGCGAYQVCSNDDPKWTLTYLTSSKMLLNVFKWDFFFFFEKLIF